MSLAAIRLPSSKLVSVFNTFIPSDIQAGTYTFQVTIDETQSVPEVTVSNNVKESNVVTIIKSPLPEFVPTKIDTLTEAWAGRTMFIVVTVVNEGPGIPYVSRWSDDLQIVDPDSNTAIFTGSKVLTFTEGTGYTVEYQVDIADTTPEKTYRIHFHADVNNQVEELGDRNSNNVLIAPVFINKVVHPILELSSEFADDVLQPSSGMVVRVSVMAHVKNNATTLDVLPRVLLQCGLLVNTRVGNKTSTIATIWSGRWRSSLATASEFSWRIPLDWNEETDGTPFFVPMAQAAYADSQNLASTVTGFPMVDLALHGRQAPTLVGWLEFKNTSESIVTLYPTDIIEVVLSVNVSVFQGNSIHLGWTAQINLVTTQLRVPLNEIRQDFWTQGNTNMVVEKVFQIELDADTPASTWELELTMVAENDCCIIPTVGDTSFPTLILEVNSIPTQYMDLSIEHATLLHFGTSSCLQFSIQGTNASDHIQNVGIVTLDVSVILTDIQTQSNTTLLQTDSVKYALDTVLRFSPLVLLSGVQVAHAHILHVLLSGDVEVTASRIVTVYNQSVIGGDSLTWTEDDQTDNALIDTAQIHNLAVHCLGSDSTRSERINYLIQIDVTCSVADSGAGAAMLVLVNPETVSTPSRRNVLKAWSSISCGQTNTTVAIHASQVLRANTVLLKLQLLTVDANMTNNLRIVSGFQLLNAVESFKPTIPLSPSNLALHSVTPLLDLWRPLQNQPMHVALNLSKLGVSVLDGRFVAVSIYIGTTQTLYGPRHRLVGKTKLNIALSTFTGHVVNITVHPTTTLLRSGFDLGDYFVIVVLNPAHLPEESSYSDNWAASDESVVVPPEPSLHVQTVSAPPSRGVDDATTSCNVTIAGPMPETTVCLNGFWGGFPSIFEVTCASIDELSVNETAVMTIQIPGLIAVPMSGPGLEFYATVSSMSSRTDTDTAITKSQAPTILHIELELPLNAATEVMLSANTKFLYATVTDVPVGVGLQLCASSNNVLSSLLLSELVLLVRAANLPTFTTFDAKGQLQNVQGGDDLAEESPQTAVCANVGRTSIAGHFPVYLAWSRAVAQYAPGANLTFTLDVRTRHLSIDSLEPRTVGAGYNATVVLEGSLFWPTMSVMAVLCSSSSSSLPCQPTNQTTIGTVLEVDDEGQRAYTTFRFQEIGTYVIRLESPMVVSSASANNDTEEVQVVESRIVLNVAEPQLHDAILHNVREATSSLRSVRMRAREVNTMLLEVRNLGNVDLVMPLAEVVSSGPQILEFNLALNSTQIPQPIGGGPLTILRPFGIARLSFTFLSPATLGKSSIKIALWPAAHVPVVVPFGSILQEWGTAMAGTNTSELSTSTDTVTNRAIAAQQILLLNDVGGSHDKLMRGLASSMSHLRRLGFKNAGVQEALQLRANAAGASLPRPTVANAVDAEPVGLPASFGASRSYGVGLRQRTRYGSLGLGWQFFWDMYALRATDVTADDTDAVEMLIHMHGTSFYRFTCAEQSSQGCSNLIPGSTATLRFLSIDDDYSGEDLLLFETDEDVALFNMSNHGCLVQYSQPGTGVNLRVECDPNSRQVQKVWLGPVVAMEFGYLTDSLAGDVFDLLGTIHMPDGSLVQYTYDMTQRLLLDVQTTIAHSSFEYATDHNGVYALTAVEGSIYQQLNYHSFSYDLDGRLTSVGDSGQVISYQYTEPGRVQVTDSNGVVQHLLYDADLNLAAIQDGLGRRLQWRRTNQLISDESANGQPSRVTYVYDSLGRTVGRQQSGTNGNNVRFRYHGNSTVLAESVDGGGLVTQFIRNDSTLQLEAIYFPLDESRISFTRSSFNGAVNRITNRRGLRQENEFQNENMPQTLTKKVVQGSETWYFYSNSSRQLTTRSSDNRTSELTFDEHDRLVAETTDTASVQKSFHLDGKVRTIELSGAVNFSFEYHYDNAGRLISVIDLHSTVEVFGQEFRLNGSRLVRRTYNGGQVATDYSYDAGGQPSQARTHHNNTTIIVLKSRGYDENWQMRGVHGCATTERDNSTTCFEVDYEFTDQGWLRSHNYSSNGSSNQIENYDCRYEYNTATGLRRKHTSESQEDDVEYTATSWGHYKNAGEWSYSYDGDGNRESMVHAITAERGTFTWDAANRLSSVEYRHPQKQHQDMKCTFRYSWQEVLERIDCEYLLNGTKTRTELIIDHGATTVHGAVLAKLFWIDEQLITSESRMYLRHDQVGQVAAVTMDGTLEHFHFDLLQVGNMILTTDAEGVALEWNKNALRQPFGSKGFQQQWGAVSTQVFDRLGLILLHERILDSYTGQFLTADPQIEATTGRARYVYADNTPLTVQDHSGQLPFLVPHAIGAVISGGAYLFTTDKSKWSWRDLAIETASGAVNPFSKIGLAAVAAKGAYDIYKSDKDLFTAATTAAVGTALGFLPGTKAVGNAVGGVGKTLSKAFGKGSVIAKGTLDDMIDVTKKALKPQSFKDLKTGLAGLSDIKNTLKYVPRLWKKVPGLSAKKYLQEALHGISDTVVRNWVRDQVVSAANDLVEAGQRALDRAADEAKKLSDLADRKLDEFSKWRNDKGEEARARLESTARAAVDAKNKAIEHAKKLKDDLQKKYESLKDAIEEKLDDAYRCFGNLIECTGASDAIESFYETVGSCDPNDILGPEGKGDLGWVSQNEVLQYTILFENDPELATAPALKVVLEQTLDKDVDLLSLELVGFGFSDQDYVIPTLNGGTYQTRLTLENRSDLLLDVFMSLDFLTRQLTVVLQSIASSTGLAPTGADDGFLPINTPNGTNGQGYFTYTVKATCKDNNVATVGLVNEIAWVDAAATITFDENEAIDTPKISNPIDGDAPTVDALRADVLNDTFVMIRASNASDGSGSGVDHMKLVSTTDNRTLLSLVLPSGVGLLAVEEWPVMEETFVLELFDLTGNFASFTFLLKPFLSTTKTKTTNSPSTSPSATSPTTSPSASPSTSSPTTSPSASPSTSSPTTSPSASPSTSSPTIPPSASPSTSSPTASPSASPSTSSPTTSPSTSPSTSSPTTSPSAAPSTSSPTTSPSTSPSTSSPTTSPSASPSASSPTTSPSTSPTTSSPTTSPSASPTKSPSTSLSISPTVSNTISTSSSIMSSTFTTAQILSRSASIPSLLSTSFTPLPLTTKSSLLSTPAIIPTITPTPFSSTNTPTSPLASDSSYVTSSTLFSSESTHVEQVSNTVTLSLTPSTLPTLSPTNLQSTTDDLGSQSQSKNNANNPLMWIGIALVVPVVILIACLCWRCGRSKCVGRRSNGSQRITLKTFGLANSGFQASASSNKPLDETSL